MLSKLDVARKAFTLGVVQVDMVSGREGASEKLIEVDELFLGVSFKLGGRFLLKKFGKGSGVWLGIIISYLIFD